MDTEGESSSRTSCLEDQNEKEKKESEINDFLVGFFTDELKNVELESYFGPEFEANFTSLMSKDDVLPAPENNLESVSAFVEENKCYEGAAKTTYANEAKATFVEMIEMVKNVEGISHMFIMPDSIVAAAAKKGEKAEKCLRYFSNYPFVKVISGQKEERKYDLLDAVLRIFVKNHMTTAKPIKRRGRDGIKSMPCIQPGVMRKKLYHIFHVLNSRSCKVQYKFGDFVNKDGTSNLFF